MGKMNQLSLTLPARPVAPLAGPLSLQNVSGPHVQLRAVELDTSGRFSWKATDIDTGTGELLREWGAHCYWRKHKIAAYWDKRAKCMIPEEWIWTPAYKLFNRNF